MADLRNAKRNIGSVFPELVVDSSSGFDRIEPLLTPDVFRRRFLWGIPMISPLTQEKIVNDDLVDYLKRGVAQFELDAQVDIMPTLRRKKLPFHRASYTEYMFLEFPYKPMQKINKLAITSASYLGTPAENDQYPIGGEIFIFPQDWIEPANMTRGLINVVPLNPAFSAVSYSTAAAGTGAALLTFLGSMAWIPAFFVIEAVTGFCNEDGNVPVYANEAIGAMSAILVIDNLIPLFRITSSSLSIDGLGQSASDNMFQLLTQKRQTLMEQYAKICNKIKTITGSNIFSSDI